MNVAFHFNAGAEKYGSMYGRQIEAFFFRVLLGSGLPHLHLKISEGDLLAANYFHDQTKRENILEGLLGYSKRWMAIDHNEFAHALFTTRVYVVAAEALSPSACDVLHTRLQEDDSYLGALEIYAANPVHWALYRQMLVPKYRFFNGRLSIFYRAFEEIEGAYSRDYKLAESLQKLGFRSVAWEDTGIRGTILDSYDSYDDAKRTAELSDYVSGHLDRLADDILLRLNDLNPQLGERLHSAFKAFELIETNEEIAHVSLSIRRFLEGLADVLYPPRDAPVEGKKLDQSAYKNRLWAYVKETLKGEEGKLVEFQLEDLGHRIDKIVDLSNKGLHGTLLRSAASRLLVALIVTAHDLVSLKPPSTGPTPTGLDQELGP
jgi:hypothetical protein